METPMTKLLPLIYLLLTLTLLTPAVQSASFTLGAGTGSEADMTAINGTTPTTNSGTAATAWVNSASPLRVLINWSALKDSLYNRTADSGYLQLKVTSAGFCSDCSIDCYQIRPERDWIEIQATWNIYKTGSNWTTAGCGSISADRYSTLLDSHIESDFSNDTYARFYITNYLKNLDGADTANCRGMIVLQGSGSDQTGVQFYTDDNANSANRPTVTVFYHAGIDTPGAFRRRLEITRRALGWRWPAEIHQNEFSYLQEDDPCASQ
jgi:hypothetical protein